MESIRPRSMEISKALNIPRAPEINTTDGEATFTQRYSPLPDWNFSVSGDYTHRTIAPGLQNGIQGPVSAPTNTLLPNGNTVLPNGSIVSPTGQIVGQTNPALVVNGVTVVDPYDQYTGSARVDKIFSDGTLSLSASTTRLNYEQAASSNLDFTATSFTEDATYWLGPLFYVYSDGVFAHRLKSGLKIPIPTFTELSGDSGLASLGYFALPRISGTKALSSLGNRQAETFTEERFTYYPTADWTISAHLDETINISSQTTPSNFGFESPRCNARANCIK